MQDGWQLRLPAAPELFLFASMMKVRVLVESSDRRCCLDFFRSHIMLPREPEDESLKMEAWSLEGVERREAHILFTAMCSCRFRQSLQLRLSSSRARCMSECWWDAQLLGRGLDPALLDVARLDGLADHDYLMSFMLPLRDADRCKDRLLNLTPPLLDLLTAAWLKGTMMYRT